MTTLPFLTSGRLAFICPHFYWNIFENRFKKQPNLRNLPTNCLSSSIAVGRELKSLPFQNHFEANMEEKTLKENHSNFNNLTGARREMGNQKAVGKITYRVAKESDVEQLVALLSETRMYVPPRSELTEFINEKSLFMASCDNAAVGLFRVSIRSGLCFEEAFRIHFGVLLPNIQLTENRMFDKFLKTTFILPQSPPVDVSCSFPLLCANLTVKYEFRNSFVAYRLVQFAFSSAIRTNRKIVETSRSQARSKNKSIRIVAVFDEDPDQILSTLLAMRFLPEALKPYYDVQENCSQPAFFNSFLFDRAGTLSKGVLVTCCIS